MPRVGLDVRRAAWGVVLVAYVVALVTVVLAPSAPAPNRVLAELIERAVAAGAPPQPTDHVIEVLLNLALTAPLTVLASLVWPRPSWRDWTAWAFLVFSAVELVQGLLLPARDGSFSDIVANTGGCCLGAVLVVALRRATGRGDRSD
ncbi:VanZ family protein [Nocardioides sp. Soil805]|uniref:VanZ family protein n=1 Tax=Nocardioides sp. Soil805 TaxID=1736416 RepID=UPI00138F11DF|nr:VanZ family protein [Nocardioides sp. Soil805]